MENAAPLQPPSLDEEAPAEDATPAKLEVPRAKKKARRKKLTPRGSESWLQELAPEVALPHETRGVVDMEVLLSVIGSRHLELEQKLEGWMNRQEELLQELGRKLPGLGESQSQPAAPSRPPAASLAAPWSPAGPSHIAAKPAKLSAVGRSPTLKNFAEKVLRKDAQTLQQQASSSQPTLPKAVAFSDVAESVAESKELRSPTGSEAAQKGQDLAHVLSDMDQPAPKTKKNAKKLRTSREVQAAYQEKMRKEMKKTRRHGHDLDDSWKARVADLIETPAFEIIMMVLSVTCAVVVGVEVNWFAGNTNATSAPLELIVLNHVLTLLFTLELFLKLYIFRLDFFFFDVGWHALDILIVGTGLAELIIDIVNYASTRCSDCSENNEGPDLSILRAVRIVRAVRLARLARLVQYIRELRRLILSVVGTLKAVFWAIVLLALFIYAFAVIFQQAVNDYEHDLISKNATSLASGEQRDRYFHGLARTCLTLLQTATGGVSWIEVEATLAGISPILVAVFLVYFSFIYFAVLNVVTAVFCSSAIESASEDANMLIDEHIRKCEEHTAKLSALFKQIDADGSNSISILEFEENFGDPAVKALFTTLGIDEDKAWKLFEILDENEDGEINVEEFVSRCFKLRGNAQRLDTERIYAVLKRQGAALEDISGYVHDLLRGITSLLVRQQHGRQGTIGRSNTNWNAG